MAQQTIVRLIDDLDGGEGDETVEFALDGLAYEIDLSEEHAAELREFLAAYVGVARRRGGFSSAPRPTRASRRRDLADIRTWANENGYEVSDRGRIAAHVVEAYDRAH